MMKASLFLLSVLFCAVLPAADFSAPKTIADISKIVSFQKWNGPADLSAKWSIRMDGYGVHFRIRAIDDKSTNVPAGKTDYWDYDSVQMAFASPGVGIAQVELIVFTDSKGNPAYRFLTPGKENFRKCDVKIKTEKDGREYHISIPWQSLLPLNPFEQKKFLANFIVNDNDGHGRKSYCELARGIGESKFTGKYPVFTLPADLQLFGKTQEKLRFVYPASGIIDPSKKARIFVYCANTPEFTVALSSGGKRTETKVSAASDSLKRTILTLSVPTLPAVCETIAVEANHVQVAQLRVIHLSKLRARYNALVKIAAKPAPAGTSAAHRHTVIRASLPTLKEFIDLGLSRRAEKNLNALERLAADRSERTPSPYAAEFGCGAVPKTGKITIGNGWFYRSGRPVWLSGYNGFVRIHRSYNELAGMGTPVMALDLNPDSFIRENPANDKTPDVRHWFNAMNKHDLQMFAQIPYHYLPYWVGKKYPEGKVSNTFWHFSSFHPAAREVESRALDRGAKALEPGKDRIPFINLTNEPFVFDFSDTGIYAQKAYREFLKKKFSSITELNKLYGTQYRSFDEIPIPWTSTEEPDFQKVSFAAWVDYLNFHRDGIADFFLWMNKKWRSVSSIPVTHKLLGGSFAENSLLGHPTFRAGIDVERILRDSDLAGCDLGMGFSTVGKEELGNSGVYMLNFLRHHFASDLLRSLSGGKTMVNTENHLIPNARPDLHYSAAVIRTMLYGQLLHGLAGHTLWVYENIQSNRDLSDTVLSRPEALYGISETTAEINEFMPILSKLNEEQQVALYYSWPSMIAPSKHYNSTLAAYHALLFRGLPIGFISERMLARGETGKVKLLICADAARFDESEAVGLKKFIAKGGRVLFIGDNAVRDSYDRVRKNEFGNVRKIKFSNLSELRAEFSRELKTLGLGPALTAPNGSELIGVEFRKIKVKSRDGKLHEIFILVNYLKNAAQVKLPAPGIDLMTGKKYSQIITIPSGGVALITDMTSLKLQ